MGIIFASAGFRSSFRTGGGREFYNVIQCLAILDWCESNGVGIVGIEGFWCDGEDYLPDLEAIADFSNIVEDPEFSLKSVRAAREFFDFFGSGDGRLFEFVVME